MIAPDAIAKRLTTLVIATSPNNTESCFQYDFARILNMIQHSNVMVPRIQLVADPKFSLPLPPPKEDAPTESRENPIAVTTLAATIRIGQNTIVFCNCNNFKQILPCSAIQILGVVHYNEIRTKKDKYKGCFICNMDILIMKKENMSLTA